MNREAIRERYLQDGFPKRLGALAANLGRISSFSQRGRNEALLRSLLEESEFFVEWTTLEAPLPLQENLVGLQVKLAIWLRQLEQGQPNFETMGHEAQSWSEKLLGEISWQD